MGKDADRFASASLLPRGVALDELPRPLTLSQLGPLKARWGMSITAPVMRAGELGVITAEQKTSSTRQLSARGWSRQEPGWDSRRPEQPRSLRRMAEIVYGRPLNTKRLAEHVGRCTSDVARDVERYAADAGRPQSAGQRPSERCRALVATQESTNSTSSATVLNVAERRRGAHGQRGQSFTP